eukprot:GDKH01024966.1.p3 GENE.GDKH01024966.1~~GDKH01024966.1.p3  ORF type:complete len:61 (-),score=8.91 GDKH01024966.1:69-251(-)
MGGLVPEWNACVVDAGSRDAGHLCAAPGLENWRVVLWGWPVKRHGRTGVVTRGIAFYIFI